MKRKNHKTNLWKSSATFFTPHNLSHHILSPFIKINVNVKYLNQRKKEIKKIIANLKIVYIKKQVEQERKNKKIHDNASQ